MTAAPLENSLEIGTNKWVCWEQTNVSGRVVCGNVKMCV